MPSRFVRGRAEGVAISSIEVDSRKVMSGALFVALRGEHADGHAFIAQAVAKGAVAVVAEPTRAFDVPDGIVLILIEDTRRALSAIAAGFYGDPSRAMSVVGITGTNGKTTATMMTAAMLGAAGIPCGIIGTVGAQLGERSWTLANTTPLAHELHGLLAEMRDAGARAVAMEVSSHALALDRVEDVGFAVGAFTNLTRDHLDFHGTIDAYAAAKRRLFDKAHKCVLNAADALGATWADELRATKPTLTYALSGHADLVPSAMQSGARGTSFAVGTTPFVVHLPGRFNVANALCALGCVRHLGVDDAIAARGLANLQRVPGRMERVPGPIDVVVDYAHTPDSLENALNALREITNGALAVVFGCGGDRDRGKRALMGKIAARLADRIYITNDNPRSEDPRAIADAIVAGIDSHEHIVELDRRIAIERAIAESAPGDTVLIAGKGHETYQLLGDAILPFDDSEVARAALAAMASR
jgi:UDP-N-acetylmuramoyl-L-alanyl-D-glutamate--2,6-diaminopimelate ligase